MNFSSPKYSFLVSVLILSVACSAYSYQTAGAKQSTRPPKKIYTPSIKKYISYKTTDAWVDSVFNTLTLKEKIGQLFMVAAYSNKDQKHTQEILDLIYNQHIGGLIFFQGGPVRQANLTNLYQSKSKVPLLIAMDAEWGLAMRIDSTIKYPRQMMLGAIKDNGLIYEMGCDIADQCKKLGVHVSFSPVLDVNNNEKNPVINSRSFGEIKENVADKGIAYMQGLQDGNVLANGKHFPGHGDTDQDSHKTLPSVGHDKKRLDSLELFPFKKAIEYGLGSIMVAHLSIPKLDSTPNTASSISPSIVQQLLKKELGFDGLTFTDALNMKGVSGFFKPGEINLKALLAGNDMLLFPEDVPNAIKIIENAIDSQLISMDEINKRCKKILQTKKWAGLDQYNPINTNQLFDQLHINAHDLTLRKLIESAITVVKNDGDLLPLKNLDTLKILQIAFGETDQNSFQKSLQLFKSIDIINIPKNPSDSEVDALMSKIKDYNLLLTSFHKTNEIPSKNFGISEKSIQILELVAKQRPTIHTLFANPYSLAKIQHIHALKSIIVSYEEDERTQDYTAQLVFGAIGSLGHLPVSSGGYKAGFGIETPVLQRLKYTIPEELGIQATKLAKIDSIVLASIKDNVFPGCQVLVAKEGHVIYNKSFGTHTYEEALPVQNSDVYDIASITKIAASLTAIMKLEDLGMLNLDGKLKDYIPEIVKNTPYANLNLREILAHQAGLVAWIPFYQMTLDKGNLKSEYYSNQFSEEFSIRVAENIYIRSDFLDTMYQTIVKTPLGKKEYKYSDLGYYLLKAAIEKQTGVSINEYLQTNFYSKMGLSTTTYLPRQKFSLDRIIPTEFDKDFRKQIVHGDVHDPGAAMMGGIAGHAGLFSNANDLAKIMQMYLNFGYYGDQQFIKETTVKEFSKCQYCGSNRRGAGFDKPTKDGESGPTCDCVSFDSFGHSGFTGTLAWADPEEKIVYIFLSNRVYPDANNKKLVSQNTRSKIMRVIFDAVRTTK